MSPPPRTARRVVTTCAVALLAAGLAACGATESPTTTSTTPAQAAGHAARARRRLGQAAEAPGAMTAMFDAARPDQPRRHRHRWQQRGGPAVELDDHHDRRGPDPDAPSRAASPIPAGGRQVLQPAATT